MMNKFASVMQRSVSASLASGRLNAIDNPDRNSARRRVVSQSVLPASMQ
jgi:hypothetical protein